MNKIIYKYSALKNEVFKFLILFTLLFLIFLTKTKSFFFNDSRRKAAKLDPAHQKMIHEKQKQIQEQLRSVETAIRKKRAKLN